MARKGSRKVRTGCLTCKARKVKCDEAKPKCQRCINTGRRCEGYVTKPTAGLLWHRPRQLFQSIDTASEGRALQFFCEKTAQFLSGATDPYFWTHLVMQFSNFEPAVRHSVVAISSLYEQFQAGAKAPFVHLGENSLALQHYNAAIRELKTTENQPLVLLVCILFICIEFMLSNKAAAIQHCKHGIALLENANYSWAREYLVPVFRRLSVFPFFFGKDLNDFPDLVPLENPMPPSFRDFAEAQSVMDSLVSRSLRLIRWGDAYRFGNKRYEPVPNEYVVEREEIGSMLDKWHALFLTLDANATANAMLPTTPISDMYNFNTNAIQAMSRAILLVRYEVCRIWLDVAFETDETCYDWHLDSFRRVIGLCQIFDSVIPADARKPLGNRSPKFIFETGFMPLLQFVTSKCRDFDMRLEALRLMTILGVPRENLWEIDQIFAISRRVIEIEHDVVLDDSGRPITPPSIPGLPADEKRIRFSAIEPNLFTHVGVNNDEVCGWTVDFVMRNREDEIVSHSEFLPTERPGPITYPVSPPEST
ncbi:hypothetical protein F4821DRAFT_143986 [Hypoxylon rubiginosum]|uniref:Uncharacterized protein n=1 Tax=Hypoxylon rubiginosum TaxID=110542 RepID=A0ACC0CZK2_9PEZI|nr:hypothetical protein F4821DRAFT_143986 [Hypoxylon rubiginosum]